MRGNIVLYNLITDISTTEYNNHSNDAILEVFLEPLQSNKDPITDSQVYKEKLALLAVNSQTDDLVSKRIISRLIHTREKNEVITPELLLRLHQSAIQKTTREKILTTTESLYELIETDILFKELNPTILKTKLTTAWIDSRELDFLDWYVVNKYNTSFYIKNIITAYTKDDFEDKRDYKYKLLKLRGHDYRELRIFLVAVHKKTHEITYFIYDPDTLYYNHQITKLLRDNFLFSLRDDIV